MNFNRSKFIRISGFIIINVTFVKVLEKLGLLETWSRALLTFTVLIIMAIVIMYLKRKRRP